MTRSAHTQCLTQCFCCLKTDERFVYILLDLVQGGELYSIIHQPRNDGMPEKHAMFYAAGVAEGLAFMHRRGFVYRDLKPENVLIDKEGYPVIIDFGFAKFVKDKTYTLCGTPLYLPPEVILNRGHNWSADHWSLGVLIFELISGDTPFYEQGMDQMDLFRAIVKGEYFLPRNFSEKVGNIVDGFLTKNPAQRLGSLANREDDIYSHPWFANVNWDRFRQKLVKAPNVPKIKNPLDASNFDDWSHLEDKTKMDFPALKPAQEQLFDAF
jgi:serine/threonine protein kinase